MPNHFLLFAQAADAAAASKAATVQMTPGGAVMLALVGIVAVFTVLSMIALAIGALPIVLEKLDPWLPKLHGEKPTDSSPTPAEALPSREKHIVAAIGYVLLQEMRRAKE